jgi:hypothetical protein
MPDATVLFGNQIMKLDDTTVTMLLGAGGVVLLLVGYLLFDYVRGKIALKRLETKRRKAQESWEREQKEAKKEE